MHQRLPFKYLLWEVKDMVQVCLGAGDWGWPCNRQGWFTTNSHPPPQLFFPIPLLPAIVSFLTIPPSPHFHPFLSLFYFLLLFPPLFFSSPFLSFSI